MSQKPLQTWQISRMCGVLQLFMLTIAMALFIATFFILAKGQSFRADLPGPSPDRPDKLMIPVILAAVAVYCVNQVVRVRLKWNDNAIQDTSRYFVFREFKWRDLTKVTPTADGIGRSLVFGRKGQIDMTQTGGSGTIPLRDIAAIEKLARKKLRENAGAS